MKGEVLNKKNLFDHFERHYFHALEVKDKLPGRIQLTFALLFGEYTAISYMLRTVDYTRNLDVLILFVLFLFFAISLSLFSIRYLLKAFHGNEYAVLPLPFDIEKYRLNLIQHKAEIDKYNDDYPESKQPEVDVDERLFSHIFNKYQQCSSTNLKVNTCRMNWIHDAIRWMLLSAVPLIISCLIFIVSDLDSSSPRLAQTVRDEYVADAILQLKQALQKEKGCTSCKMINQHHNHPQSHTNRQSDMRCLMRLHIQEKERMTMRDDNPPPPPAEPSEPPELTIREDAGGGNE